jgi:hypothetical protein
MSITESNFILIERAENGVIVREHFPPSNMYPSGLPLVFDSVDAFAHWASTYFPKSKGANDGDV